MLNKLSDWHTPVRGVYSEKNDGGVRVRPQFLQPHPWLQRPRAKIVPLQRKMGQNQTLCNS